MLGVFFALRNFHCYKNNILLRNDNFNFELAVDLPIGDKGIGAGSPFSPLGPRSPCVPFASENQKRLFFFLI